MLVKPTRAFGLCADVHAHNWSQFSTLKDGVNSRLVATLDELTRCAREAKARGCTRVFIAGDLFHVRGSIAPSVFNAVSARLDMLARSLEITWVVVDGNHDCESRDSETLGSANEMLPQDEAYIWVVSGNPELFLHERVCCIPWISDRDKFLDTARKWRDVIERKHGDAHLWTLICHVGIDGVLSNVPGAFTSRELAELGFGRVCSGHYHQHAVFEHKEVGSSVISIGALTHQTWSDVGTRAGWMIVDAVREQFFDSEAPRFMDFDPDADLSEVEGNFVRVRSDLDEADVTALRDALMGLGALAVVFVGVPKALTVTRSSAPATGLTLAAQVKDWLDRASSMTVDREKVRATAVEILREVGAA